jgi:hypothetical protein
VDVDRLVLDGNLWHCLRCVAIEIIQHPWKRGGLRGARKSIPLRMQDAQVLLHKYIWRIIRALLPITLEQKANTPIFFIDAGLSGLRDQRSLAE